VSARWTSAGSVVRRDSVVPGVVTAHRLLVGRTRRRPFRPRGSWTARSRRPDGPAPMHGRGLSGFAARGHPTRVNEHQPSTRFGWSGHHPSPFAARSPAHRADLVSCPRTRHHKSPREPARQGALGDYLAPSRADKSNVRVPGRFSRHRLGARNRLALLAGSWRAGGVRGPRRCSPRASRSR